MHIYHAWRSKVEAQNLKDINFPFTLQPERLWQKKFKHWESMIGGQVISKVKFILHKTLKVQGTKEM
jgi:hypothetical protein